MGAFNVPRFKRLLLAATILGGFSSPLAMAQQASTGNQAPSSQKADDMETVIVTGYRKSLEDAARAKKDATNFSDSIFAEDIGKFPDMNLAESLQRLPGVQIDRDQSGEGTYINVRGLGAGFTVTTLNGLSVSTPSDGSFTGGNEGRGSSLDMLPTEFFRRITLSKSPTADMAEGGTAGAVDMQPIRAFDRKGFRINYQLQLTQDSIANNRAPRGAIFVSNTFNTKWGGIGILGGVAYAEKNYQNAMFNTVGFTTMSPGSVPAATAAASADATANCPRATSVLYGQYACNNFNLNLGGYGGGAGATLTTIPGNIPANFNVGTAGQPLSVCGRNDVAGGTSGMSCQDLSYVIVPRLPRAEVFSGARDRTSYLFNLEWRPRPGLRFALDSIYTETNNEFGQFDVMGVVRSYNNTVPINFKADQNNVLTSGTFANTYFINEARDAMSNASFFYRNLRMDWDINADTKLTVQAMQNTGDYYNQIATYQFQSRPWTSLTNAVPSNTGQYFNYSYTPGDLTPFLSTNTNLNDPKGWYWSTIQLIPLKKEIDQKGWRADLQWGNPKSFRLQMGVSKTNFFRNMSQWQTSNCYFGIVNTSNGADNLQCGTTPLVISQYGGARAVLPDPSRATASSTQTLAQYMLPINTLLGSDNLFKGAPFNSGFEAGWAVPDMKAMRGVLNLDYFVNGLNPGTDVTNYLNSYNPAIIQEDTTAQYIMADGMFDLFGRNLKYNAGIRFINTDAQVDGVVNDVIIGGTTRQLSHFESHDSASLPSVNFAYYLASDLILRGAASKSITRADPAGLKPSFGLDLDATIFTVGNPALKPFTADNYDFGIEWYPRSKSWVTFNVWGKDIFDYPATIDTTAKFSQTNLVYSALSTRQQSSLTNAGGGDYNNASLIIRQRQNSELVIHLLGQEFQWNQPLDFWVRGLGFTANVTHIKQTVSGAQGTGVNPSSLLAGLAPWTYNATVYYETKSGFSFRTSWVHRDENLSGVCACNNINNGDLYSAATDYLDAQIAFPVPGYKKLKVTIQAQNLLSEVQLRRYAKLESMPDGATYTGQTFVIGLRGEF